MYSQLLLSLLLLLLHLFMEKIDSHSQLFPRMKLATIQRLGHPQSVKLPCLSQRRNPSLIRKELKGISSMPTCHSYCQHQQQRRPYVSMSRTCDREAFLQASNLCNYLSLPSDSPPDQSASLDQYPRSFWRRFQPDQLLTHHCSRCYGTYFPLLYKASRSMQEPLVASSCIPCRIWENAHPQSKDV